MTNKLSAPKRLKLIINPIAGGGKALEMLPAIVEYFERHGCQVEVLKTSQRGDAQQAANDPANHNCSAVVVIGGDGTINEVVNGIVGSNVPLGVIPFGTGNVVARELGIPLNTLRACDVVLSGRTRQIDVGKTDHRYFVLMAGVGFDAEVVKILTERRKGAISLLFYLGPIFEVFMSYTYPPISVEIDGRKVTESGSLVYVSNTRRYTGPWSITSVAKIDDGLLDICIFKCRGRWDMFKYSLACCFGAAHRVFHDVMYLRGREVAVRSDVDMLYQIDGDLGGKLPARFTIVPGAVRVLVPRV